MTMENTKRQRRMARWRCRMASESWMYRVFERERRNQVRSRTIILNDNEWIYCPKCIGRMRVVIEGQHEILRCTDGNCPGRRPPTLKLVAEAVQESHLQMRLRFEFK